MARLAVANFGHTGAGPVDVYVDDTLVAGALDVAALVEDERNRWP